MNVMRTIPKHETQRWIDLLFQEGPHPGSNDPDPLTYPLPVKMAQDVAGGFLYIVYQKEIIGYARIARVEQHNGDTVGEEGTTVSAGDRIILDSPLEPMPYILPCRPFRRFRYMEVNLHVVGRDHAMMELGRTKLL